MRIYLVFNEKIAMTSLLKRGGLNWILSFFFFDITSFICSNKKNIEAEIEDLPGYSR